MLQTALYEFPLNERMRNFMRLENCFTQMHHFTHYNSIWDNQASLLVMIEILNILDRHDIKNDITKELERNIMTLNSLLDLPTINTHKLQTTLDALYTQLHAMQALNSKPTRTLREDDLLNNIRQRVSVAANINSFEIPSYYFWLNQDPKIRQEQVQQWQAEINPIADTISLVLNLIRDSADFIEETAEAGFFQKPLSTTQVCQMIRIMLPADANFFPEASGSKHRVSMRFMTYPNTKQRPSPITEDVKFQLSCCGI